MKVYVDLDDSLLYYISTNNFGYQVDLDPETVEELDHVFVELARLQDKLRLLYLQARFPKTEVQS